MNKLCLPKNFGKKHGSSTVPKAPPLSRKGATLKKKTASQVKELRAFLVRNWHSKWKKSEIEQLSARVGLDFKSVNKWLWDKKNR